MLDSSMFVREFMWRAISGGHHNRAWRIHEEVSKELQRILYKRFLHEKHPNIGNELIGLASD